MLLTKIETANALRVSPRTVVELARSGKLAAIRLSRRCTRYAEADIQALIETNRAKQEVR